MKTLPNVLIGTIFITALCACVAVADGSMDCTSLNCINLNGINLETVNPNDITPPPPYSCENDLVEIMFKKDARVRLRGGTPVDLNAANALIGIDQVLSRVSWSEWRRICDVSEELIDELTAQGEAVSGNELYNPNNMYRLRIGSGPDIWEICRDLESCPGIHRARPVPKPMILPLPGNYESSQGYLRPATSAPAGINADWAWTQPGGDGSGINVCDLEYSWNFLHNDLFNNFGGILNLYSSDPMNDDNHGTAVLGIFGSENNSWGTKGIAYGSSIKACGTFYGTYMGDPNPTWNVPGAIVAAASASGIYPGDVLLLEHQWDLTGGNGFVPIEFWTDTYPNQTYNGVYSSIEWAIAVKDVHVIECAGNGGINMDLLNWYGDSGAIIVGAGGAYAGGTYTEGDLQRLSFSSYGARVDCQGWGEDVVTTGYGYLYNAEGSNYYYTNSFSGTSSAAPVVAGAAASCAGYWKANVSSRFSMHPIYLRRILKTTGTPQVTPPSGNIGPRPDLAGAIPRLSEWKDVTASPLNDTRGFGNWGDYDNDGDEDLYVANSPYVSNKLFRNDGGGVFTDVTTTLLGDMQGYAGGAVWGDYDNDGDIDLYIGNNGNNNNILFRNNGDGSFSDATTWPINCGFYGYRPTWVDYDNDGRIDLYVAFSGQANKLYHNDGGGAFSDATIGPEGDTGNTAHAAWSDYDNDGDMDLYLVEMGVPNKMLRNDNGVFTDITTPPLSCVGSHQACCGDYDNDGDQDIYLVDGNYGVPNILLRNDGNFAFTDITAAPLDDTDHCSMATCVDVENDGDLDIYLINNQERSRIYLNDGSGNFVEDTHGLFMWEDYTTTNAWADYDNDGDLDTYFGVTFPANSNTLAQNNSAGGRHYLQVKLAGAASNACGIGARVRIVTGRGIQVREIKADRLQQSLIAHFGLGSETLVTSLQVFWPGGTVQESLMVAADQQITILEKVSSGAGESVQPLSTKLYPNAPNPFRATTPTLIRYDLRQSAPVSLMIYDLAGRRVKSLLSGIEQAPGSHPIHWDGRDDYGHQVAPGVYFYRLNAGAYRESRRMLLMR
ncbi:MAG: VCBS repeat-containing protein [Candidatus Eisenbacteria bacterium]|uniref:VCBS repeat-containing protein n=1 Tax=Eiseniibacteriota bacterium TaxID=2212470 RepID=A0A948RZG3_UNCEI|nr:VCBS repeat-containing protein [Candidatus Eisenbacteria bacterium]MBU1950571.1 VCBS repeat-containing protein [Candidatus Eisenbacteria bacterium]MBU2693231.1 VCBS repeat-containing protein [Candidatus Eisenbacteria bacterium]